MKIVHIIFSFSTGGTETMLVDILNEQSKTQEVELIIVNDVVNKDLTDTINHEVKIHYLSRKPGSRNLLPILQFNYIVFKINPTVIHFHNHNGVNLLKHKTKTFTCLTIHSVNTPIINLFKYKKIFAISNAVQEDILTRGSVESIRVYNGIPLDTIVANGNFIQNDTFKIIQVSRLEHEIKGQHILIKALNILVKQKEITNIQLDFIGDGSSLEYLKKLVKELDMERNVNFLGMKTREFIYKELKNYQLLVQPSFFEGFGLTVVEGMAAKIPVLISDIDGPMEIIDRGKYGFYFKCGDIEDCSEMIYKIINDYQAPEITKKINEAYDYVKENFNIQKTAQNYINNYK